MEYDTEGQIESREHQQSSKSLQQYGHQADLEHVGVKQHQQNDDQVEQDGNVLDYEKYELHSRFSPQQLAEGVYEQVEGEQAELNQ